MPTRVVGLNVNYVAGVFKAQFGMTILEYLPGSRSAMSWLTYSGSTSDFSAFSPAQRDTIHKLASTWAQQKDSDNRQLGLRLGLRGGWPEFTILALNRLSSGAPQERIESASSLAAHTNGLGQEHIPSLIALARTNTAVLAPNLVLVILRIGGPAATNALLELARADEPVTWWSALSRLNTNLFAPVAAQTAEMQQRLWMVNKAADGEVTPAIVAAGKARLTSLLTIDLRALNYSVFESVLRSINTRLDRPFATQVMMNYLRAGTGDFWRQNHPAEIIRQLNDWYGKDFGGLGGLQKAGRNYPAYDAWPAIVEDVLEFGEKLKLDEKSNP